MNKVQIEILEIFKYIQKICKQHNITYFAIGGTCLGAVRHNGFIPWDDDMDIAIPIEQYDYFIRCAKEELPSNLKIYSWKNAKHTSNIFIKIHNENTTFIEESVKNYPDAYKGIWVDIMPISGIPNHFVFIFKLRILVLYYLNRIRRYPFSAMRNYFLKILWIIFKPISLLFDVNYFSQRWMNLLKRHPFNKAKKTGYVWNKKIINLVFPKRYFDDVTEIDFENIKINCPIQWDKYLSFQFKDYMKMPPKEKTEKHNAYILSLDKSYKEYLQG